MNKIVIIIIDVIISAVHLILWLSLLEHLSLIWSATHCHFKSWLLYYFFLFSCHIIIVISMLHYTYYCHYLHYYHWSNCISAQLRPTINIACKTNAIIWTCHWDPKKDAAVEHLHFGPLPSPSLGPYQTNLDTIPKFERTLPINLHLLLLIL